MNRINVTLGLARLPVAKKIEKARFIVTSMTGNPAFTSPNPTLPTVTGAINNLEAARLKALAGGPDDTADMHVKEEILEMYLKLLAAYVVGVASANTATAEAVILSAGMNMRAQAIRHVKDAAIESLAGSKIRVSVRFVNRATFIFQMTTNPADSSSWQTVYEGTRSKFVMPGLTPGTRYHFRVSVIDKNGRGPWTEILSAIAL